MAETTWRKLSSEEIRLAKRWYGQDGLTRLLVRQVPRKKQGRAPLLSKAQVDSLPQLHDLVMKANAEHRVTVSMLRKSTKMKASCRVILEALNERGVYLCKLWEKPVLTEVDVKQRLAFTRRYKAKTAQWLNQHMHVFLDGKFFKTYLNAAAPCPQRGQRQSQEGPAVQSWLQKLRGYASFGEWSGAVVARCAFWTLVRAGSG